MLRAVCRPCSGIVGSGQSGNARVDRCSCRFGAPDAFRKRAERNKPYHHEQGEEQGDTPFQKVFDHFSFLLLIILQPYDGMLRNGCASSAVKYQEPECKGDYSLDERKVGNPH